MAKGGISKFVGSLFGSGGSGSDDELDLSIDIPDDEIYKPLVVAASMIKRDLKDTDVIDEEQLKRDRLFVVSVSEFYDAMGGRRGRLAESLPTVCETVFLSHRGPKDHHFWINQDHFAMRFENMDDPKTFEKAGNIIEEIGIKLLGDHFIRTNSFQAMAALVTGAQIVNEDGTLNMQTLDAAIAEARNQPKPSAEKGLKWRPFRFASMIGKNKWFSRDKAEKNDPKWQALQVEKKKPDPSGLWQEMRVDKNKKPDPTDQWQTMQVDKREKPDPTDQWQTMQRETRKPPTKD